MKTKFLLLTGVAALLSACGEKYTITANCDESDNGTQAYLYDLMTGNAIDSTVVTNGNIVFNGNLDGDAKLCRISFASGYSDIFVLEGGNIVFEGKEATGTPQNDSIKNFINACINSRTQHVEAYKALDRNAADYNEQVEAISNAMRDDIGKICTGYIEAMPGSRVATYCLINWLPLLAFEEELLEKAVAYASETDLQYPDIQKYIEINNARKATAKGQMFTDFTIEHGNLDSTAVSLSDYVGKGKYILVDFWASWCGPCRAEIPNVKEVYNRHHGDRFDIVSVAVWDRRAASLKAIEELTLPWNQIVDAGDIPTKLYGIPGIPELILFAPDGTIAARGLRGDVLKQTIADALAQ